MRAIAIIYYFIIVILGLSLISRVIDFNSIFKSEREDIRHTFLHYCVYIVSWTAAYVSAGLVNNTVASVVFLLIAEFMKIATFVFGTELCASITDRVLIKRRSSYSITAELLYFGVALLCARVVIGKGEIVTSYFGRNFSMPKICILLNAIYFVVVIFFFGAYSYMYYYGCKTKREHYISRRLVYIVSILTLSLFVETIFYTMFDTFVPSMFLGIVICSLLLKDLIIYKRSIEYNESDYEHILSSINQKPAFVCDDEGRILFENTRAFVMRQTYKDTYKDRLLTDIFEISDYDIERLNEPRITQVFDVYCKYSKEPKEMLLNVKHNLDRFGDIFSTEVEVGYANALNDEVVAAAIIDSLEKDLSYINLTMEDTREIRINGLIRQLEIQKKLYEENKRELYEYSIKGITKAAGVLGMTALENLCDRIQKELTYGEWESLEPLMIDIDRQYETLKMISL